MQSVWLPYYTCDALLQPFDKAGIPYQFYALNEQLEIMQLPALQPHEYVVYINYFGLKEEYVSRLALHYGENLIVDNTQNYFAQGYEAGWSVNSARKTFGVPDGGFLYGPPQKLGTTENYPEFCDYQAAYLLDRLRGAQKQAYEEFVAYEATLTSEPQRISAFSTAILSQVDYHAAAARRRQNFAQYAAALGSLNELEMGRQIVAAESTTVPFCYPLLLAQDIDRQALFGQNIFVPWLWRDVLGRLPAGYAWERHLALRLLPLPLDHRYGPAEIERVIDAIRKLISPNNF